MNKQAEADGIACWIVKLSEAGPAKCAACGVA